MSPRHRRTTASATLLLGFFLAAFLVLPRPGLAQGSPDGKALFDEQCARCHGEDGQAKTFRGRLIGADDLTDADWQAKEEDKEIAEAIRKGPGMMPEFEDLSQAEVEALVAFIRTLKRQ